MPRSPTSRPTSARRRSSTAPARRPIRSRRTRTCSSTRTRRTRQGPGPRRLHVLGPDRRSGRGEGARLRAAARRRSTRSPSTELHSITTGGHADLALISQRTLSLATRPRASARSAAKVDRASDSLPAPEVTVDDDSTAQRSQSSGRRTGARFPTSSSAARARWLRGVVVVLLISVGVLLAVTSAQTWETFGLSLPDRDRLGPGRRASTERSRSSSGPLLTAAIAHDHRRPDRASSPPSSSPSSRRAGWPPRSTFLVELLAAIPSVVIGLWGVFILAPFLRVDGRGLDRRVDRQCDPVLRRARLRRRDLRRRCHPGDHDPADDRVDLARGHQRRARLAARGACSPSGRRAGRRSTGRSCRSPGPGSSARSSSASVEPSARRWRSRWSSATARRSRRASSTRRRRSPRRSRRPSARRRSGCQTSSLIALGLTLLVMTILLNIVARLLVRRVAGDGVGMATGG